MTWHARVFHQLERPAVQAYLPRNWMLPALIEAELHRLPFSTREDLNTEIATLFAKLSLEMSEHTLECLEASEKEDGKPRLAVSRAGSTGAFKKQQDELTRLMMHLTPRRCFCRTPNCICLGAHVVFRHTAFLLRCMTDRQLKPSRWTMHAITMAFLVTSLAFRRVAGPKRYLTMEQTIVLELRSLRTR